LSYGSTQKGSRGTGKAIAGNFGEGGQTRSTNNQRTSGDFEIV
jgi:hypothetical protein